MIFSRIWILGLLAAYLSLVVIRHYIIRRRSLHLPPAGFLTVRRTWRTQLSRMLRIVPVIVCVLILIALADPQTIETRQHLLPSGIDIVVAMDVSGSMAAEDFQPLNRLEVAKDVLKDFIAGRPSDRIGLVLFAGKSVTRSPLTLQHGPLLQALQNVRMGDLPEGTAIGSAIMSGLNRLSDNAKNSHGKKNQKILVLITDGRNNAGEMHPLDALALAVQQKIKIYTIGVGSFGPVPFPVVISPGKKGYRYERVDIDEGLLGTIAQRSGGKYFRASDPKSLQLLFAQINQLEKSEPEVTRSRVVESKAQITAMPALFLGLCYMMLTIFVVRLP